METNTYKEVHQRHLCQGLVCQLEHGKNTDTTISVQGETFHCHRVVLSAVSSFFDAMYSSGMKESVDGVVTLHNVTPSTFRDVLHFMYNGTVDINDDNVVDFLRTASIFQITTLLQICEKFLLDILTSKTVLEVWRLACVYNCSVLKEYAWEFIVDNFSDLCRKEEFLEVSKDELLTMLNDDNLNVVNEESVCDAVLTWIRFDQSRVEHLLEILHNLRFPLMRNTYLTSLVESNAFIKENKECRQYLEQMTKTATKSTVDPQDVRERNEPVLVMVDGRRQDVICFSLQRKKCFSLAKFPYFADGKASCTYNGDIYVCGGTTGMVADRLVKFESKRNRWEECASMLNGRCYHELVTTGDCLYSLGGFAMDTALSSIEEYNTVKGSWQKVGDLVFAVGGMSAAVLHDTIYIFGGKRNRVERKTPIFQSFNTKTKTSTGLGNLPINICWSQALTIDDSIYVISPDGNVIKYCAESHPSIVSVIKDLDCQYFRIIGHNRKIIILQVGDSKNFDELRVYDPKYNSYCVTRERLPRSLCDSDWLKVVINRRHLKYEYLSHGSHR